MIFKKEGRYDRLKTIALIFPSFIALFKAIGEIWNIPYTGKIVGSMLALEAFLGALVKVSSMKYNSMEETEASGDLDE